MKTNSKFLSLLEKIDNEHENQLTKLPSTVKSRQNKKYIESLRSSTYNITEMFGELADNSGDADATKIEIHFFHDKNGKLNYLIVDNGFGMSAKILETAVEFGSNYVKDNTKTGKYGVGGSNATIALGKKREVITQEKDNKLFYERFNLISLADGDVWYPQVFEGSDLHSELYSTCNLNGSGTIIRITEVDEESQLKDKETFKRFQEDLIRYFGVTYKDKLKDFSLYVNGVAVNPIDPILWDDDKILHLGEGIIEIKDSPTNHEIKYRAVIFPEGGVAKGDSEKKYDREIHAMNPDNMGVYLYRNGRLIEGGLTQFGTHKLFSFSMMGTKQRWWSRFRIELSFNSDCDKKLGIAFSKNKTANADINAIREITKVIYSLQSLAANILDNDRKANKNSKEKIKGDISKDHINSKLKGKVKPIEVPKIEIEKKKNGKKIVKIHGRTNKTRKSWVNYVEFQYVNDSPNDPIFTASQLSSNTTTVTWNTGHNFYKNCVAKLDDEKAIEWHALIFAWARAQMELIGMDIKNADGINATMKSLSDILNTFFS